MAWATAMYRLLDRYILRETTGPLVLGLLVFTFLALMQELFQYAEMIIGRNVEAGVALQLLAYSLPHIVVLTIPMAFLFAILIAIGRMAADSELVAMRASGISLWATYRPVLLMSLVLSGLTGYLTTVTLPAGNKAISDLRLSILTRNVSQQVKPKVFYDQLQDRVLYVFEAPENGDGWRGVFLADAVPGAEQQVIVGETGQINLNQATGQAVLRFGVADVHEVDTNNPGAYRLQRLRDANIALEDGLFRHEERLVLAKDVRSMTLAELFERAAEPGRTASERNRALVEIHKKFAIPAACLVFGLYGIPLGFRNRRGGRSSGFLVSVGIFLFYYVLLGNGEEAAANAQLPPWLAMWAPNIILSVLGTFLLWRRNRDKSLMIGAVDRLTRDHLWRRLVRLGRLRELRGRRRRAREHRLALAQPRSLPTSSACARIKVRMEPPGFRFPGTLDRYIFGVFVRVLAVTIVAALAVFIVSDFTQLVDEMLQNDVPSSVFFEYYPFLSLQVFYDNAPILVLVTTLVTFGLLSQRNEVIAAKALGFSLFRLAVPALLAAVGVAVLSTALENSVLPASNAKVIELRDRIRGNAGPIKSYHRADRQWRFAQEQDGGGYIYNYRHYDADRATLQRLQVFRFDARHRLTRRLYAAAARFVPGDDTGRWELVDAWIREFDGLAITNSQRFAGPQPVDLPEEPEFFNTEVKYAEQMNRIELRRHIDELEAAGTDVPDLKMQLHNKTAMPVVSLVMALVALPFAFRLGRQGALYGIGISIVVGIVYYTVISVFTTLGQSEALPPLIAAWSPNALFATLALYLFLGVRT